MRKTFRKRPAEDDPSDGDGDSTDLGRIAKRLEEARQRQRHRSKQVLEAGKPREKPAQPDEEEQFGLQERDPLGGQFTGGSTPWGAIEHEDKMKEYIEKKLSERRGFGTTGDPSDSSAAAPKSIDELALEGHGHEDLKLTTDPIEDANRWLTGIQEVQLPIEYKIRNIEDTEEARKRAMIAARQGRDLDAPRNVPPKGFHSRFVVGQQIRGIAQIADQPKGASDATGGKRPTDDAVYSRYVTSFMEKSAADRDKALANRKKPAP
jgi:hypothetical protein